MTRPLRSLLIGDTDRYFSPYIFGVAQGCHALGLWHSQVSIRQSPDVIMQRVRDVKPDLVWLHMGLWPPEPRITSVEHLAGICTAARSWGAKVLLHDGDVKQRTRHPHDISAFVNLALCNHRHDRSAWNVPTLYWPYAAFVQDDLAPPVPAYACSLLFAGKAAGGIYDQRSKMVAQLREKLDMKVFDPTGPDGNTMFLTPTLATSATCVLGFGRPDQADWVDTRVFQYPGAGGILVHDDVRDFLPMGSYASYETGNVDSVVEAVHRVQALAPEARVAIRRTAFDHVQTHHSWTARVRQVLETLEVG